MHYEPPSSVHRTGAIPCIGQLGGTLGSGASELAIHRSTKTIPISGADEFFQTLQQRVDTLEQSQRQNPLSVELLVNSTKRYLAKPEHRIQLDELLSRRRSG